MMLAKSDSDDENDYKIITILTTTTMVIMNNIDGMKIMGEQTSNGINTKRPCEIRTCFIYYRFRI